MESVKVVVVGDRGTGKTNLLHRRKTDQFPHTMTSVGLFNDLPVIAEVKGKLYSLNLCDTTVQDEIEIQRPLSYTTPDVALICFSIDNPKTFENVQNKWHQEIRSQSGKVPIILVGTKSDLRPQLKKSTLRKTQGKNLSLITYAQGMVMKKLIKANKYVECSALTSQGVAEVFAEAIKAYNMSQTASSSCWPF